jgi:hypothetical protein
MGPSGLRPGAGKADGLPTDSGRPMVGCRGRSGWRPCRSQRESYWGVGWGGGSPKLVSRHSWRSSIGERRLGAGEAGEAGVGVATEVLRGGVVLAEAETGLGDGQSGWFVGQLMVE